MSYETHPAALLFPMMAEAELKELAEDIKTNGLQQPIVLYHNKVLDGRNRLVACELARVQPRFTTLNGNLDSPTTYVLSHNLHRRHLTASQRGAIAAEAIPLFQEEARKRQEASRAKPGERIGRDTSRSIGHHLGRARELAAKATGVGEGTLQRALEVKKRDPETFDKIKRGEITAWAASRGHKEPPKIGGNNRDKSSPYELDSERKRQLANSQFQKMADGLMTISGICTWLPQIDRGMIAAHCKDKGEELVGWATRALESASIIRDFAKALKGEAIE